MSAPLSLECMIWNGVLVLDSRCRAGESEVVGDVGRRECIIVNLFYHAVSGIEAQQADCMDEFSDLASQMQGF